MGPALFDTSIYITSLRGSGDALARSRALRQGTLLWLSAVVLAELYAGADDRDRPVLERLHRDFDGAPSPGAERWRLKAAGKMLARLGHARGFEAIGRARMFNDALIAASAARMGITVINANAKDFRIFGELCPLRWTSLQEWNNAG
jgi:predicted nucleic acid-binding protein